MAFSPLSISCYWIYCVMAKMSSDKNKTQDIVNIIVNNDIYKLTR